MKSLIVIRVEEESSDFTTVFICIYLLTSSFKFYKLTNL